MAKIILNNANIEALARKILREWEKEFPGDEGNTIENARESAKAEIRANNEKLGARGEALEKKPRAPRKLDTGKVFLLEAIAKGLEMAGISCAVRKDADISFQWKDTEYTVKLVKHRKPKV